jgi:hypothetical protein
MQIARICWQSPSIPNISRKYSENGSEGNKCLGISANLCEIAGNGAEADHYPTLDLVMTTNK